MSNNSIFASEIRSILEKPIWQIFIYVWLFYLAGLFLYSHFVWSIDVYSLNYTGDDLKERFERYQQINLVLYILSVFYLLFFSSVLWLLFKGGLLFYKVEIDSKLLFKIAIIAQVILFFPYWVKAVWFILIEGSYTMDEIKTFYPFSIINFFDIDEMPKMVIKALAKIDLFRLFFVLFSAYCIKISSKLSFFKAVIMIVLTYGLATFLLELVKLQFVL